MKSIQMSIILKVFDTFFMILHILPNCVIGFFEYSRNIVGRKDGFRFHKGPLFSVTLRSMISNE